MSEFAETPKFARRIRNLLRDPVAPDGEALLEAIDDILEDYRRHVVCDVIRSIRASTREAQAAGQQRAAHERAEVIGELRKQFGVSASKWPGTRKRHRQVISLKALYERDGGVCRLGWHPITLAEATRDHITPLGRGGKHTTKNIQLACRPCNEAKGNSAEPRDPDANSTAAREPLAQAALAGC